MNIYKEHVIEALEDEPLSWGMWVTSDVLGEPINKVDCTVCAVGSVFRKFTNYHLEKVDSVVMRQIVGIQRL